MLHNPNSGLLGIELVRALPQVDPTKVASSLPGDVGAWASTGFWQVLPVGGTPAAEVRLRRPVLQLSAWAVNPNSQKAPWGKAQAIAELVFNGLLDPATYPLTPEPMAGYIEARILQAYPISEPRQIPGSQAGYAQVQFDFEMRWVKIG